MKNIKITLEEITKHLDHPDKIMLDYGRASLRGEKPLYEYGIYCKDCKETIGTVITIKAED
jgi:hypothetical protein